jgi:hypothetical protein
MKVLFYSLSHFLRKKWTEKIYLIITLLFQIGVVIEDKDFLDSSMNGEPWQAGKFAYTLRSSLWSEHLGISEGEVSNINQT